MKLNAFEKNMADLIFLYRKNQRLTLEELSEKVKVDVKSLGKIERGKQSTFLFTYFKIAKALNIPITEIANTIKSFFTSDDTY